MSSLITFATNMPLKSFVWGAFSFLSLLRIVMNSRNELLTEISSLKLILVKGKTNYNNQILFVGEVYCVCFLQR